MDWSAATCWRLAAGGLVAAELHLGTFRIPAQVFAAALGGGGATAAGYSWCFQRALVGRRAGPGAGHARLTRPWRRPPPAASRPFGPSVTRPTAPRNTASMDTAFVVAFSDLLDTRAVALLDEAAGLTGTVMAQFEGNRAAPGAGAAR